MSGEIERLKEGNESYAESGAFLGDVTEQRRSETAKGQKPYAVIVTCSDSRVIPEAIFSAGAGDLFVIRTAGNVIGKHEEASVEYALHHLHARTVVVLGHTRCGAVAAALAQETEGRIGVITKKIVAAIKGETDPLRACRLNVLKGTAALKRAFKGEGAEIVGAIYDIESGKVSFLI